MIVDQKRNIFNFNPSLNHLNLIKVMTSLKEIEVFFEQKNIAVAGVSRKKQKFGNAIFKELAKKGYKLYPINPHMDEFEGNKCYHSVSDLPGEVTALVINTKKDTTLELLKDAETNGIKHIWMQQGCADKETIKELDPGDANVIAGKCILMFADPVGGIHNFHRWLVKTFGNFPN